MTMPFSRLLIRMVGLGGASFQPGLKGCGGVFGSGAGWLYLRTGGVGIFAGLMCTRVMLVPGGVEIFDMSALLLVLLLL